MVLIQILARDLTLQGSRGMDGRKKWCKETTCPARRASSGGGPWIDGAFLNLVSSLNAGARGVGGPVFFFLAGPKCHGLFFSVRPLLPVWVFADLACGGTRDKWNKDPGVVCSELRCAV
jgi:hypothetical protein